MISDRDDHCTHYIMPCTKHTQFFLDLIVYVFGYLRVHVQHMHAVPAEARRG